MNQRNSGNSWQRLKVGMYGLIAVLVCVGGYSAYAATGANDSHALPALTQAAK